MTVEWVERGNWGTSGVDKWAAGTGGAWTDRDLYTSHTIPKGAIVYIICENFNDAADRTMGVRIKGSSLNRYIILHEAETGGGTHYGTWVKTDANGYIQYYASSTTGTTFFIAGYLTGSCDFTEAFELKTATSGAATGWIDWTLAVGASATHYIVAGNPSVDAQTQVGIRTNGSSIVRTRPLHESESLTPGYQTIAFGVKSDSSKIIEYYHTNGKAEVYWDMGYFNSDVDYQELATSSASTTTADTWEDYDCTSIIDTAPRLMDCFLGHYVLNAEEDVGCRTKGSSYNDRFLLEHESESNSSTYFNCPARTNSSGYIQFYCGTTASEVIGTNGYYIFTEPTPSWTGYCFGTVIG